ncbi:hypothetical protein AWC15_08335 [Mycobacterium lacus]|uniref:MinD/ParA family ATP-binding protein n=1 Tax=Mycobacterium lacus TaxID=169765 RepID=UPI000A1631DF|nr:MinD/ParA family protein [Mycobacterium lacus]ORW00478.1 hypothetical protein AWC15_08335 [Mycobacterium lacus]
MPADYDKLFRPADATEPADDETYQPDFDATASYPPPPAPTSSSEPNGEAPAPAAIDWSQQFPQATPPPVSLEPPSAPPEPPLPPMPIGGPPPAPPEPPPAPPEPAASPMPVSGPARTGPRPPAPPMPIGGPPPPPPRIRPSPPSASLPTAGPPPAAPKPPPPPMPASGMPQTPQAPSEPPPRRVRIGAPQQSAPPEPPSRPPAQHSPRARRGHRYRPEPEPGEVTPATRPSIPLRPRTAEPGLAPPNAGPERSFATPPRRAAPIAPAPVVAPAPGQSPPHRKGHRRAKRRADRPTVAQPETKKPARLVPRQGWRRWVHTLTRINFGLSRDEKYLLDLRTRISRKPRGSYQIGILGLKGGAGKTTTTVTLGNTLAQVRGDRILVLDADPGAGNLADRAGRSSPSSIADLLADDYLSHYNDVRAHTSVNENSLEILPAAEYTAAQRGLSGADLRFAVDTVSKFYNIVLADCGAGLFDPVTLSVLETASAIVIVTNVSVDSARQAEIALDWLRNNGYQDLLSRACVVINHVALGETNVAEQQLVRQFSRQVQPGRVVLLPWDKHIAAGTQIQLDLLNPVYKRRVLELAAALSDDFERAGRR